MVRSPALGLIGADTSDERLVTIRDAVKIGVVIDGQERRMEHPQGAIVVEETAGMVHLREDVDLVRLTISIGVDAANHPSSARLLAERALFIDPDEDLAGHGSGDTDRVVHLRRLTEEGRLESIGNLDVGDAR